MQSPTRWRRLTLLAPVLVCLPCLLAPLLVAGGAAVLSAGAASVTGWWLPGAALLLGGGSLAAVLAARRLRGRAPTAACSVPAAAPPVTEQLSPIEVQR